LFQDYVETVYDEFQGPSQGRSNKTAVGKKMNSRKKDDLELKNSIDKNEFIFF
jgi:hypothetical protein